MGAPLNVVRVSGAILAEVPVHFVMAGILQNRTFLCPEIHSVA